MSYYVGTKALCEALRDAESRAHGLPRPGVHIGGGVHADLNHPSKPGWTLYRNDVRKHPVKEEYAYPTADLREEDVAEEDKASVAVAKASSIPSLPKDWEPNVSTDRSR